MTQHREKQACGAALGLAPRGSISDLAILGGAPLFDREVYVGRPNIPNHEGVLERFAAVLRRGWISNAGPCVQELEERLRTMMGVRHCIVMCNGTVALEIAIRAMDLTGEVIVPSFTFIATAHALQWQQITPVFCDIDPETNTIDPAQVKRLITPRTTGIIGVHLWGRPCNVAALQRIAEEHDLRLIFDAAHAFGCTYEGRLIGSNGDAEVFSFHATKFFNTIEGGAVATNSDELANKIRLMKNFGFTAYDSVDYIGTNGKMNEMCAAMGLAGLEEVEAHIQDNYEKYLAYRQGLEGIPGIRLVEHASGERSNHQYIVIKVDAKQAGLDRDSLVSVLHAENVLARRYFYPGCHRMEPYRSFFPNAGLLLAHTEKVAAEVICLPTGSAVSIEEVSAICGLIRIAVEGAEALQGRIPADGMRSPRYGSFEVQKPSH